MIDEGEALGAWLAVAAPYETGVWASSLPTSTRSTPDGVLGWAFGAGVAAVAAGARVVGVPPDTAARLRTGRTRHGNDLDVGPPRHRVRLPFRPGCEGRGSPESRKPQVPVAWVRVGDVVVAFVECEVRGFTRDVGPVPWFENIAWVE